MTDLKSPNFLELQAPIDLNVAFVFWYLEEEDKLESSIFISDHYIWFTNHEVPVHVSLLKSKSDNICDSRGSNLIYNNLKEYY